VYDVSTISTSLPYCCLEERRRLIRSTTLMTALAVDVSCLTSTVQVDVEGVAVVGCAGLRLKFLKMLSGNSLRSRGIALTLTTRSPSRTNVNASSCCQRVVFASIFSGRQLRSSVSVLRRSLTSWRSWSSAGRGSLDGFAACCFDGREGNDSLDCCSLDGLGCLEDESDWPPCSEDGESAGPLRFEGLGRRQQV